MKSTFKQVLSFASLSLSQSRSFESVGVVCLLLICFCCQEICLLYRFSLLTGSNWVFFVFYSEGHGLAKKLLLNIFIDKFGNQTWLIKWDAVSSRLWSCRYCCMDALLGRWLNGWRRSSTAIIQECCEQYWTSPGSNTPQGANCTVAYHLSWKLYKLDEPDMPDTAGEAKTRS